MYSTNILGKFRINTLAKFRAGSQMEWNNIPSRKFSRSVNPSSSVLFTMEHTKDWKRESACVISIWFPAPMMPSGRSFAA